MNLFTQDNSFGSDQLKLQFQQLCIGSPQQTELKLLLPIFQSLSSWVHVDIAPDSTTPLHSFAESIMMWLNNQGVYDRNDCEILDRLLRCGFCFGKFWLIDLAFPDIKLTFSPTSQIPYLRIGLILEVATLQGIISESYAHDIFEKVTNDSFDLLELARILLQILQFSSTIIIRNFLFAMKIKQQKNQEARTGKRYTNRELLMFNIINNQIDYEIFFSELATKLKIQREEFYNIEIGDLHLNKEIRFDPNFPLCFMNGIEYKIILSTDQTYLLNSLSLDLIFNNQSYFPSPPYQFCQQSLAIIFNQELIILADNKVVASSILEKLLDELQDDHLTTSVLKLIQEQIYHIITMQQHWTQQQLNTILLNVLGNLLDQQVLIQLIDQFKITELVCPLINKIQVYPQLYSQRLQWQLQSLHYEYDHIFQEQLKQEWVIEINPLKEEKTLNDLLIKYGVAGAQHQTTEKQPEIDMKKKTPITNPRRSLRLKQKKTSEITPKTQNKAKKGITWLLNEKMEVEDQQDDTNDLPQNPQPQDELIKLKQQLIKSYPRFTKAISELTPQMITEGINATSLPKIDQQIGSIRVVTKWKENAYDKIALERKVITVPEAFDIIQRINFIDNEFSELRNSFASASHLISVDQILFHMIEQSYCYKAQIEQLIQSNPRYLYPNLLFNKERYQLQEFIYTLKLQLTFAGKTKCTKQEEQEILNYNEFSNAPPLKVAKLENCFMIEQPITDLIDFRQCFNLYSIEDQGLIRKLRKKEIGNILLQDIENIENLVIINSRKKEKVNQGKRKTVITVTAISGSANSCLIKAIAFLKYRPETDFDVLLTKDYYLLSLIDFIYIFQDEFISINNIRYIQSTTSVVPKERMIEKFVNFEGFQKEVQGQLFYWFQVIGLSINEIEEWDFQFKKEYELILLSNYPNHWIAMIVSDKIMIQQDGSCRVKKNSPANTTIIFIRKKTTLKQQPPEQIITNISQEEYCLIGKMKMPASILTPALDIMDIKERMIQEKIINEH